eukprot:tig00000870_g5137.t1
MAQLKGENVRGIWVARLADGAILAQYAAKPDANRTQAIQRLFQERRIGAATSLTLPGTLDGGARVHFTSGALLAFLVATAPSYPARVAFQLVSRLSKDFTENYGAQVPTATEDSLSRRSRALLSDLAARFEDPAAVDKVTAVSAQVDQARGVMANNIQLMLQNQDSLENLNDTTHMLRDQSRLFVKQAGSVKRSMCCQSAKMTIILVVRDPAPGLMPWPSARAAAGSGPSDPRVISVIIVAVIIAAVVPYVKK